MDIRIRVWIDGEEIELRSWAMDMLAAKAKKQAKKEARP